MEQLAQDLFVALEESESCGPIQFEQKRKWGLRRKARSAENLNIYAGNVDHSDENSSSSNSEIRPEEKCKIVKRITVSFHHSDSDDMSLNFCNVKRAIGNSRTQSLRMKHPLQTLLRGRCKGVNYNLESDSVNENSPGRPVAGPGRPSQRRKRKLKRMSVDEEAPQYYNTQCGKRKRAHHRMDCWGGSGGPTGSNRGEGSSGRGNGEKLLIDRVIRPLHPSVVDKIERFCQPPLEETELEVDIECGTDIVSESSLSWSGGEGHDGDDELTDWAPGPDTMGAIGAIGLPAGAIAMDTSPSDTCDGREVRAGCRRLGGEPTPGFTISTAASERVARFVQDSSRTELKLCSYMDGAGATVPMAMDSSHLSLTTGCVTAMQDPTSVAQLEQLERDKLSQLAALYSLDLWFEGPASLLRKTARTPCMRPPHSAGSSISGAQQQRLAHHSVSSTSTGGGASVGGSSAAGHKKIRTSDRTKS